MVGKASNAFVILGTIEFELHICLIRDWSDGKREESNERSLSFLFIPIFILPVVSAIRM